MIRRTAACLLVLSLGIGAIACGKYGPPERQSEQAERPAPAATP